MNKKKDPIKVTISTYDEIAEEYCGNTLLKGDRNFQIRMMDRMLDMLQDNPRIIDLGCGDGRDTSYLDQKGADVVGIDLSGKMVEIARDNYPQGTFIQNEMRETIFPDNTFNGVWASASIIHLSRTQFPGLLKEVARILIKDGIFVFSFKEGKKEGFEGAEDRQRYFTYYTVNEIRRHLKYFKVIDFVRCPKEIMGSKFIYCFAKKTI